jgi:cell division transport system permease protein
MMSFSTLEFLIVQTMRAVRRNPLVTMASITNVAVALTILGGFFLVAFNLNHMADQEAQAAVITCELTADAKPADVEAALLADQRVKRTKYVTREESRKQLADKLKLDLNALKLVGDFLPNSILVYVTRPEDLAAVAQSAKKIKGVALARYPEQVTAKLLTVARGVKLAGVVVGVFLCLATLTVINTTIRLTIYARRREIRIMQLVGATKWFIRLPFLLEGLFQGLIGGILAAVLVSAGYAWVTEQVARNLQFLKLVDASSFLTLFAVSMVLAGALFGVVGSLTGIRRYLRLV